MSVLRRPHDVRIDVVNGPNGTLDIVTYADNERVYLSPGMTRHVRDALMPHVGEPYTREAVYRMQQALSLVVAELVCTDSLVVIGGGFALALATEATDLCAQAYDTSEVTCAQDHDEIGVTYDL